MPNCLTLKKSNCKNCYKCIRHCPVKAIRFSGNQAHIIGNECILCGQCFVVCPQDAKEIVDETEKVKVFLQSGDPVVVSLAPSFIANYEGVGIEQMEKALKETIIRVKQNSIEYREAHANPTDINAMMQFIKERKELQQLEKLHISIN
mgnify:CR=1 FL=1